MAAAPVRVQAQAGRTVLDAEALAQAGVTRLTDLLPLVDAWSGHARDGYTWSLSANALASTQEAAWQVWLDDHLLDLNLLGTQHLNAVPVPVSDLDSVVVYHRPQIDAGTVALAGSIRLYTRRPRLGVNVGGSVTGGNEIGDPGPFRYTPFATPNIDRVGPILTGTLAAADVVRDEAQWQVLAAVRSDEHHVTDDQVVERVYALYEEPRNARLVLSGGHASLRAHGRVRPGRPQAQIHAMGGLNKLRDLRYIEPLGQEVPTEQHTRYQALGATLPLGPQTMATVRASYQEARLDPRTNREGLVIGWGQTRAQASLDLRHRHGPVVVHVLGGVDRFEADPTLRLADPLEVTTQAGVRASVAAGAGWTPRAAVVVRHRFHRFRDVGLTATGGVGWAPRWGYVDLHLSYAYQPWPDVHALTTWRLRGFPMEDRLGATPVPQPGFLTGTRRATADLDARWRPGPTTSLSAQLGARLLRGVNVERYQIDLVAPDTFLFVVTPSVAIGQQGGVGFMAAQVEQALGRAVSLQASYRYQGLLGADTPLRETWQIEPPHRAAFRARYVYRNAAGQPRFSLLGQVRAQSRSLWFPYTPAQRASGGRYPNDLPTYVLADLLVRKRFWDERFEATLAVRNLGDAPFRSHPGGAIDRLTFFVKLQMSL
ncbi:MAG: hypothetical protein AAGI71_00455 [Bacteroidota bacterium]